MCGEAGLESSLCLCSLPGKGRWKAGPSSALLPLCVFSPVGRLTDLQPTRLSRASVPRLEGGSSQPLGPGTRKEHRCTPFLVPVLLVQAEAAQIHGRRRRSHLPLGGVSEVVAVCHLPGASLSSPKAEDNSCTYLTVIPIIK